MSSFKISGKIKISLAVLACLVFLSSAFLIWDTVRLQQEIDIRTKRYIADVSVQLTDSINSRLDHITVDLKTLGDTLLQATIYDLETIRGYLQDKASFLGYSSFIFVSPDGSVYQSNSAVENVLSLPGIQASMAGKNGVSFLEGQNILYSVALYRNGEFAGVLGGIRDKGNMQSLIQPESFSGQSLTCIINQSQQVVISPTDIAPFLELDSIFKEDPTSKTVQDIFQMERDIANGKAGLFRFDGVSGDNLILAYNPLDSYGWVLLTLVPSNVVSEKMDLYIRASYLIVAIVIALLGFILGLLFASLLAYSHRMEKAAFVDSVTGGMNNTAFCLRCEALLPHAPPNTYSIILLNIKKFKLINMDFSSDIGDLVLKQLMHVLQARTAGIGFAGRMHADIFYLCVKKADRDRLSALVEEIQHDMATEVQQISQYRSSQMPFILQSGIYIVDDPTLEIRVMQDRANIACQNRTEAEDGVCKFFEADVLVQLEREQLLNGSFAAALEQHHFKVYLQPKICLADGRACGAEALVRWQHPERGLICPDEFISLFEKNGNICRLDLYVFEEVCKLLRRRMDSGQLLFPISVNLSRQHFRDPDFLNTYEDLARRYDIPRGIIELELTEAVFFDDSAVENVKREIRRMHEMGFSCSLDDFGSGFSSLGLLMEFDIDTIKLDRRLTKNLSKQKAREIVISIVQLSQKIGALTVAEGIETPEQLEFMKKARCDMVQGYIYSKPLPIPEFEDWLTHQSNLS